MKKIFLTLALVFATGTMINASSTIEKEVVVGDFDECDTFATVAGKLFQLSYEEEHNWFLYCMDNL
ncbi:hypothetical protein JL193_08850 [Polaribacter batillariae]|uniref:Uncharacterized protein n=1 Tax=Polaribacter batillariae TaxID=2808900 RepID=A0ABX7SSH7_9FLAO|nr:hypothetical protein [Polaribacter batillariae]QTD36273.1 hypothetical protein JL193_08850 [Polaribacter batillariae]